MKNKLLILLMVLNLLFSIINMVLLGTLANKSETLSEIRTIMSEWELDAEDIEIKE